MGVGRLERCGRAESLLHNANKSTLKDGQTVILVALRAQERRFAVIESRDNPFQAQSTTGSACSTALRGVPLRPVARGPPDGVRLPRHRLRLPVAPPARRSRARALLLFSLCSPISLVF